MDRVPYFDLHAQYDSIRTEVLAALEGICESTSFAQGPATADFEAKFAAYCGVDHCVSLNSGTSALHLALRCLDGTRLVANEEDAYSYWMRTVKACLMAERAYGPTVFHRVRYADLINRPEPTMRSLLDFLGEPYTDKCLEPLKLRINSSNVPENFTPDDLATDPAVVEEATRLSTELEATVQPAEASRAAADEIETTFMQRVEYVANLDSQYQRALQTTRALQQANAPQAHLSREPH